MSGRQLGREEVQWDGVVCLHLLVGATLLNVSAEKVSETWPLVFSGNQLVTFQVARMTS